MFIEAYLMTWNATEAARQAGYKHPNKQGPTLVKVGNIDTAIKRRMRETAMTADEVVRRLTEQASITLSDFLEITEKDGKKEITGINWDTVQKRGHLVKSITPTQSGIKLELHDGQTALLALAKRHGLLIDKGEHIIDMIEMTLKEWQDRQTERKKQTDQVLDDFAEDANGDASE
jgi:phage terminase small subunit